MAAHIIMIVLQVAANRYLSRRTIVRPRRPFAPIHRVYRPGRSVVAILRILRDFIFLSHHRAKCGVRKTRVGSSPDVCQAERGIGRQSLGGRGHIRVRRRRILRSFRGIREGFVLRLVHGTWAGPRVAVGVIEGHGSRGQRRLLHLGRDLRESRDRWGGVAGGERRRSARKTRLERARDGIAGSTAGMLRRGGVYFDRQALASIGGRRAIVVNVAHGGSLLIQMKLFSLLAPNSQRPPQIWLVGRRLGVGDGRQPSTVCRRTRAVRDHGAIAVAVGVGLSLIGSVFGSRGGRVAEGQVRVIRFVPLRIGRAGGGQSMSSRVDGIGGAVVVVVAELRVGEVMLVTGNVEGHNNFQKKGTGDV